MAARLRPHHQDEIRAKIKTSQLVNRLEDHAFGNIELSPSQVRSIEVLLKKTISDLQSVQLTGELEHDVKVTGALQWQPPQ
jgi:hypothetical protein